MSSTVNKKKVAEKSVETYTRYATERIIRDYPEVDADLLQSIIKPKRQIIVEVPVRLDDGTYKTYQGYRVQHNDARGPFKGGLRYHPDVDLEEVKPSPI